MDYLQLCFPNTVRRFSDFCGGKQKNVIRKFNDAKYNFGFSTGCCERKRDVQRVLGQARYSRRPVVPGTAPGAVPRHVARVAGAQEHVPGRVRVDGPGQIVLAAVDKTGTVRPDGHD